MYRCNASFWANLKLVGGKVKKLWEVQLPNQLDRVHMAETEDTIAFLSDGWGAPEAFGALLEVATNFEDEEQERESYLRGFQAFLETIGYFDGVDNPNERYYYLSSKASRPVHCKDKAAAEKMLRDVGDHEEFYVFVVVVTLNDVEITVSDIEWDRMASDSTRNHAPTRVGIGSLKLNRYFLNGDDETAIQEALSIYDTAANSVMNIATAC